MRNESVLMFQSQGPTVQENLTCPPSEFRVCESAVVIGKIALDFGKAVTLFHITLVKVDSAGRMPRLLTLDKFSPYERGPSQV